MQNDSTLLDASRLPLLEEALIDLLVPTKQQIVRDQTVAQVVNGWKSEARLTLPARERSVIEQLFELRGLQGKNQSSIERMTRRALAEQREFEEVVRKIVAARAKGRSRTSCSPARQRSARTSDRNPQQDAQAGSSRRRSRRPCANTSLICGNCRCWSITEDSF